MYNAHSMYNANSLHTARRVSNSETDGRDPTGDKRKVMRTFRRMQFAEIDRLHDSSRTSFSMRVSDGSPGVDSSSRVKNQSYSKDIDHGVGRDFI